jgi:hypothetical protein
MPLNAFQCNHSLSASVIVAIHKRVSPRPSTHTTSPAVSHIAVALPEARRLDFVR